MSLPTTKEGLPSRGPPLSPVYRPVVFRLQVSQLLVEPAQSRPHAPQVLLHLLQVRLHLAHVLPWRGMWRRRRVAFLRLRVAVAIRHLCAPFAVGRGTYVQDATRRSPPHLRKLYSSNHREGPRGSVRGRTWSSNRAIDRLGLEVLLGIVEAATPGLFERERGRCSRAAAGTVRSDL